MMVAENNPVCRQYIEYEFRPNKLRKKCGRERKCDLKSPPNIHLDKYQGTLLTKAAKNILHYKRSIEY